MKIKYGIFALYALYGVSWHYQYYNNPVIHYECGNSSYGDSPIPGFETPYYVGKVLGHAWTITLAAVMMKGGLNMTLGGAVASGSGIGIVVSVDGVLIIAKGFKVIINVGTNLGKDFGTLMLLTS